MHARTKPKASTLGAVCGQTSKKDAPTEHARNSGIFLEKKSYMYPAIAVQKSPHMIAISRILEVILPE